MLFKDGEYRETIGRFLVTDDGKKLVVLGKQYHDILEMPAHLDAVLTAPYRKGVTASLYLITALTECFPAFRPYGGAHETTVPHLTVAQGQAPHADAAAKELVSQVNAWRATQMTCDSVALIENSSGRWKEMHLFRLLAASQSA